MSNYFVGRKPIFDKSMKLYGYELIYQQSEEISDDSGDDQTTATLVESLVYSGFDELIFDTRGFISFSHKLILDQIPHMLPGDKLVVQISADEDISEVITLACKTLSEMRYTLAIKDFRLGECEQNLASIMPYVDMIKVDCSNMDIAEQKHLVQKYGQRVMLVADHVETMEAFQSAAGLGYHLFSGFFYSDPVKTKEKAIGSLTNNLVLIASELSAPEPDYKSIGRIFEGDVELSYKLLRRANSAYYGATCDITSIRQALVHVGTQDLLRWAHLMIIKGFHTAENEELVKASLIRGKMLSLLALQLGRPKDESDFFIAGIFSSIDALLGESMDSIVRKLPLSKQVEAALVNKGNDLGTWVDAIIGFERTQWQDLNAKLTECGLVKKDFMTLYVDALKWCLETNMAMY